MVIKRFLKAHYEVVLLGMAIVLVGALLFLFSWSVANLAGDLRRATDTKSSGEGAARFDLEGAKALNLESLSQ